MPATPFMEAHYFANDCFMQPNQLIDEAGKLKASRHHRAGPLRFAVSARNLARARRAVAEAEIRLVEGAGHTLYDPGVRDAVMKAIADMASRNQQIGTTKCRCAEKACC
jgi:proline iminopeptidase